MVDTEMLRTIADEHPHAQDSAILTKAADELDRLYEVEKERDALRYYCDTIERTTKRCHPLDAPENYFWVALDGTAEDMCGFQPIQFAEAECKEHVDSQTTYLAAVVSKFEPVDQPYTRTDY